MNLSAPESKKPMRQLFQYLGKYKRDLWLSSIASFINKLFDMMPPILTAWFIDAVSGNTPSWIATYFGIDEIKSVIVFLAFLTIFIFSMESLFQWMYKRGFMRLAQKAQHDLRIQTYQRIQNRELAFFEHQRIGNLMSVLNDDVNQLERFLNDSFNTILQLIILFLFAGTALLWVSVPLGLLAILPIPFIMLGSFMYQKKVGPYYKEVREKVGELGSRLENNLSGIQVIKSFAAEAFETQRVAETSAEYREANFKAIRWNAIYIPIIRIIISFGFTGTLALGAWWVYNGQGGLTIGSLALFAMMTQRLLWPITGLGQVFNEYERAKAAARRIFGVLHTNNQLKTTEHQNDLNPISGQMEWRALHFSYDQNTKVLQNINLSIPAGKFIGVVGLTGAGKTTLIKLLLRFYDLGSGDILFDGRSILTFPPKLLREQIALVSQEVYLFHGTIRENMCYGRTDISEQAMEQAAKKVALHDFISGLADGYDSMIGERGIKLSGGQRQRLSLARAILKDAAILILDEATSSIDTATEKVIQSNLSALIRDKTAIVIAHRLSTVRQADEIIVIGDGQIVEKGTHDELVERGGAYANLWAVQIGALEA